MISMQAATSMDLEEAASFLGIHPATLQQRAASGEIAGAKVGRSWRFLDVDLVAYMRSQYPSSRSQPQVQACAASTRGRAVKHGMSSCTTKGSEFEQALGLPARRRPRRSTTGSAQSSAQDRQHQDLQHGGAPA